MQIKTKAPLCVIFLRILSETMSSNGDVILLESNSVTVCLADFCLSWKVLRFFTSVWTFFKLLMFKLILEYWDIIYKNKYLYQWEENKIALSSDYG